MDPTSKKIKIVKPFALYKWAKNFKRIQDRFYGNQYKLRRIQQIEDFITLNNFNKVHHIEEVHIDLELSPKIFTHNINDTDLNIDNSNLDMDLPDDFQKAITSWLQKSLKDCVVMDLSRNYVDYGQHFTWSLPDRHYYIVKK